MVEVFLTVAERVRAALNTRRDLILETVALRHQLGVLARSDRRFRPGDRLFWLCLWRLWHRWKEALVLVEPATVSRWHRQGFAGCWRRRSRRRPGRPRIDSDVQSLIRCMATSNCLWGAPRIHGELLKLGITVSERTVSRYIRDRMRAPSQSWRTFLANELGQLVAFASTVTSSDEPRDHDVADARLCPPSVPLRLHATGSRSHCRAVGVCRLGPPRFTARLLVGILPRITRTTTRPTSHWQGSAEVGRCRNLDQTRADGGDSPSFGDRSRTTS
jgi:hypothetical protein